MKRILIHFLILLMLTPGLACGPILGAAKAQAAQPMQDMEDCKGMEMDSPEKIPGGDHVFFKDCSKVDLFSVDQASFEKPNLDNKIFFTAWVATTPDYSFTPAVNHTIRGPPPDWPDLSQTQPSILLTTQRFRE